MVNHIYDELADATLCRELEGDLAWNVSTGIYLRGDDTTPRSVSCKACITENRVRFAETLCSAPPTCPHDPEYSRSECGVCGDQDSWCKHCGESLCACSKEVSDVVNSPEHYTWLPVEAIEITELFSFTLGNALKYILRADHKGKPVEDLKKARWYLDREIARREKSSDTA